MWHPSRLFAFPISFAVNTKSWSEIITKHRTEYYHYADDARSFPGLGAAGPGPWEILKDRQLNASGVISVQVWEDRSMFLVEVTHLKRVLRSLQPVDTLHALTEPLLLFYSVASFQDPIIGLSAGQLTSLQLYIISMWWAIVTHYVHQQFFFFCISCCLLFLNLSSGYILAIFERYSLSSKLVWLCAHTPPTAESFYHWNEISWIA